MLLEIRGIPFSGEHSRTHELGCLVLQNAAAFSVVLLRYIKQTRNKTGTRLPGTCGASASTGPRHPMAVAHHRMSPKDSDAPPLNTCMRSSTDTCTRTCNWTLTDLATN